MDWLSSEAAQHELPAALIIRLHESPLACCIHCRVEEHVSHFQAVSMPNIATHR
jgi:hypothetical protein